jgi:hypothetical protein
VHVDVCVSDPYARGRSVGVGGGVRLGWICPRAGWMSARAVDALVDRLGRLDSEVGWRTKVYVRCHGASAQAFLGLRFLHLPLDGLVLSTFFVFRTSFLWPSPHGRSTAPFLREGGGRRMTVDILPSGMCYMGAGCACGCRARARSGAASDPDAWCWLRPV